MNIASEASYSYLQVSQFVQPMGNVYILPMLVLEPNTGDFAEGFLPSTYEQQNCACQQASCIHVVALSTTHISIIAQSWSLALAAPAQEAEPVITC